MIERIIAGVAIGTALAIAVALGFVHVVTRGDSTTICPKNVWSLSTTFVDVSTRRRVEQLAAEHPFVVLDLERCGALP